MTTRKLIEKYRNPETSAVVEVRYSYDKTSKAHCVVSGSDEAGWAPKRFASIYMAEAELAKRREMVREMGYADRIK